MGRSVLFSVVGLAAAALNTWLFLFWTFHYPILWGAGGILVLGGLRAFDRRVKLRIDSEGVFYASWAARTIPWDEFEGFRLFQVQKNRFVEACVRCPDQFRHRLGALSRLKSANQGHPSIDTE